MEGHFKETAQAIARLERGLADVRAELRQSETAPREEMNQRFDQVDRRFATVDARFLSLETKIDRHFTWLVGIQIAVLVSVVGALVGSYYR
jgi:tetrahydromethanopterin S-methyltransferase subunit G